MPDLASRKERAYIGANPVGITSCLVRSTRKSNKLIKLSRPTVSEALKTWLVLGFDRLWYVSFSVRQHKCYCALYLFNGDAARGQCIDFGPAMVQSPVPNHPQREHVYYLPQHFGCESRAASPVHLSFDDAPRSECVMLPNLSGRGSLRQHLPSYEKHLFPWRCGRPA